MNRLHWRVIRLDLEYQIVTPVGTPWEDEALAAKYCAYATRHGRKRYQYWTEQVWSERIQLDLDEPKSPAPFISTADLMDACPF